MVAWNTQLILIEGGYHEWLLGYQLLHKMIHPIKYLEWRVSGYVNPSGVAVTWSLVSRHMLLLLLLFWWSRKKIPNSQPSTPAMLSQPALWPWAENLTGVRFYLPADAGSRCCNWTTSRPSLCPLSPSLRPVPCVSLPFMSLTDPSGPPPPPCLADDSVESSLISSYQWSPPCARGSCWPGK